MCLGHLEQMAVSGLLRRLNPGRKLRDFLIIHDECELERFVYFQPRKQNSGLLNGNIVLWCLCESSDKAKFCNRARRDFRDALGNQVVNPVRHPVVELVLQEAQRNERVDIQQLSQGKAARMSSTCLLVRRGSSGPAVRTGRPVTGSSIMRTFRKRALLGVSTTRSPSTLASSGSPARRPSFRRIGLGRTTWPLAEILVFMVRESYACDFPAAMPLLQKRTTLWR